jgi:hypothetical protein
MIGKDTFFGLAGHPTFDWPNPRGAQYPTSLRHFDQGNLNSTLLGPVVEYILRSPLYAQRQFAKIVIADLFPNLLTTTLGGEVQAPFAMLDWPNPRGYTPSTELRTWLQALDLLTGQDQFFGLAGHPNFDWPNPRGPGYPISLRHWDQGNLNPTLLAEAVEYILRAPLYVQRAAVRALGPELFQNLLTTTLGGVQPSPFSLSDWPLPISEIPDLELRSWLNTVRIQLIGQDRLPELMMNWPNPPGARHAQQPILNPFNPNLPPTPPTGEQLRQIIRFAPIAFGGKTHWTR